MVIAPPGAGLAFGDAPRATLQGLPTLTGETGHRYPLRDGGPLSSVDKQFGRRGALLGIGLAATGAAVAVRSIDAAADEGTAPPRRDEGPTARPDAMAAHELRAPRPSVQALFGALTPGSALSSHWRIEAVYDVRAGAIPVVLATLSGHRFAVEIFLGGPDAPGIATAGPLALYLVNRGDGSSSSDESAGLGVMALGNALAARLAEGAVVPDGLVTLAQRRRQHPVGVFHIPTA